MKIFITLCLLLSLNLMANTPEEKGLVIAKKMEKANNGFIGESSKMEMILIDAHGNKVIREMTGKVLEVENEGDKSLMVFYRPRDVKGTKMLTWSYKNNDDDQWLYLPSFKRIKRISSQNKSASFMGSEFSYEDLGGQEIEKYKFKYLRDEKSPVGDLWVLERTPKRRSGYSKQIMWVIKDKFNPQKINYYDRKGELLKTSVLSDYKASTVNNKVIWRAYNIHMKNVQTHKESIFVWKDRKLGVKVSAQDFNKSSLR